MITVAGPRGVWPTLRSEALAEGAIEAEARMKLELAKRTPGLVALTKARYAPGIIDWRKSDWSRLGPTWDATLLDLYNAAGQAK